MCDMGVDPFPFVFDYLFVSDRYITQEFWDKVISEDPIMLKYCHDKQKTKKKFDKANDSYLLALKFVPD